MKLELIRQYQTEPDMVELLFEVDKEFMDMYNEHTGDKEMSKEGFSQFINNRIEEEIESERWKYE